MPPWAAAAGGWWRLVENAAPRYKAAIGPAMRSRSFVGPRIEVSLACETLNGIAGLGMPDSGRGRYTAR